MNSNKEKKAIRLLGEIAGQQGKDGSSDKHFTGSHNTFIFIEKFSISAQGLSGASHDEDAELLSRLLNIIKP